MKQKKNLQYKKVGRLQKNARYTIDYAKDGKADVKWSYVSTGKKEKDGLPGIIIFLMSLAAVLILVFATLLAYSYFHPPVFLENCNASFIFGNSSGTGGIGGVKLFGYSVPSKEIAYLNISCSDYYNKTYNYFIHHDSFEGGMGTNEKWSDSNTYDNYGTLRPKGGLNTIKQVINDIGLQVLMVVEVIFGLIISISMSGKIKVKKGKKKGNKYKKELNKTGRLIIERIDKMDEWLDERQAKLGATPKYRYVFKKCPENKIIEIPVFNNNCLDYEAKGQFSDYLKRIEVKEHPFMKIVDKGIRKDKSEKGKKWENNQYIFSCKIRISSIQCSSSILC